MKEDLKEMGLQDVHWIQVTENGAMWLAVVTTEMGLCGWLL